jgi:hypothetical protein
MEEMFRMEIGYHTFLGLCFCSCFCCSCSFGLLVLAFPGLIYCSSKIYIYTLQRKILSGNVVGLTWEEGIYSWSNTIESSKNEASKHVPVVFCECLQAFLTGRIILSDLSPLLATFLSLQKNLNLSGSDGNQGMEMHICLHSSIWKHKKILISLYTVCCPIYDMLPSFSAQAKNRKRKRKGKGNYCWI